MASNRKDHSLIIPDIAVAILGGGEIGRRAGQSTPVPEEGVQVQSLPSRQPFNVFFMEEPLSQGKV
jgi:hypothetical protein